LAPSHDLTVALFASDKGPGDAERSSIMSSTGSYFARHGARLVTLGEAGTLPLPAIRSARAAGGEVRILADDGFQVPKALANVPVDRVPEREARLKNLAGLADCYVALPGSIETVSSLFAATMGLGIRKPVVLLNHHRAYEVMRGLAADVLSHGIKHHERHVQVADSVEDLWHRVVRMTERRR